MKYILYSTQVFISREGGRRGGGEKGERRGRGGGEEGGEMEEGWR